MPCLSFSLDLPSPNYQIDLIHWCFLTNTTTQKELLCTHKNESNGSNSVKQKRAKLYNNDTKKLSSCVVLHNNNDNNTAFYCFFQYRLIRNVVQILVIE